VSRVYAWIQRHPKLIDAIPAVFFMLTGLLTTLSDSGHTDLNRWLAWPLPLLIGGSLVFRRRWPLGTFVFAAFFGLLSFLAGPIGFSLASGAFLILLYTVAAYRPRRYSVPALLVVFFGALIQIAISTHGSRGGTAAGHKCDRATLTYDAYQTCTAQSASPTPTSWQIVFVVVFVAGLSSLFWVLGDSMRYRREYYVQLEDRAERLERERDAQAQIAAAAERARIARELHDVVAHNVSVMVVQADGAGYALDDDPESARKALQAIAQTGRTALTEMRRMLGVLRSADEAGAYAPQPGIEQLGDLLEQVRAAGLPVTLTVEGVPREMPTGLALAVYRIVQESLTNTRKHGGPNAKATVAMVYTDDCLVLRITDDGRGAAAPGDGAGHGMVGMRERVHVFGGTLEAGPQSSGGYAVTAVLPFVGNDEPSDVVPIRDATPRRDAGPSRDAGLPRDTTQTTDAVPGRDWKDREDAER
jgi:signal transduction histidine kinase